MSRLKSPINYKSLELELQEALKADKLYKLQNDAKLRAIEQNVSTYEDFRQMVNAAHLKPLKCTDLTSKVKGFWNPVTNNDNSNPVMELIEFKKEQPNKNKNSDNLEDKLASTYKQFIQVWKTIEEDETKFNYLKRCRTILREKIFHTEIPSTLFAELIDVCSKTVAATDNITDVVEILSILSNCNRFYLTICFMGKNERQMCTKLFHDLLARKNQDNMLEDTIKLLKSSYGIKLQ